MGKLFESAWWDLCALRPEGAEQPRALRDPCSRAPPQRSTCRRTTHVRSNTRVSVGARHRGHRVAPPGRPHGENQVQRLRSAPPAKRSLTNCRSCFRHYGRLASPRQALRLYEPIRPNVDADHADPPTLGSAQTVQLSPYIEAVTFWTKRANAHRITGIGTFFFRNRRLRCSPVKVKKFRQKTSAPPAVHINFPSVQNRAISSSPCEISAFSGAWW